MNRYEQANKTLDTLRYLRTFNLMLLIVHIILLVSFFIFKVYLMVYVNIASVAFYSVSFSVIAKKKYNTYVTLTYFEVWIHMILAVICVGWGAAFEFYCFLLVPVLFLGIYIGAINNYPALSAIGASIVDVITFLLLRLYSIGNEAMFAEVLTSNMITYFYYLNIAIVFGGMIVNMRFFASYAILSEEKLHDMAEYDELTGLYNRRFIRGVLDEVYNDFIEKGIVFSVAITDVDDFKNVNDTYGHDAGDYVLKFIAKSFSETVPKDACVGRWGGEEFIVIFRNISCEDGCEIMERIRTKVDNTYFKYDGETIHLSFTAGLAKVEEGMTITDIIRKADGRLYEGKAIGKNLTICK